MAFDKVIIIGGGFGGLDGKGARRKRQLDVLLIDKTNHHLFQPLLYEVATAALSPGEIATPLREILRHQKQTSVIMGEVVSIDKRAKKVALSNGNTFSYDYLIIATGARHSYFGNNAWESYAPGLKTISDALRIREQILISFEKAERLDSISEASKYLNFVVLGGGPTGVEMAGAIAEIAHKTMFKNFRRIRPETSQIYLVEALPRYLQTYPETLSLKAKRDLEKMGVKVLTGKKVTKIDENGVQVEDLFIACKNIIWAAGNEASALLKTLDTPLDRSGRVLVEPDLTVAGQSEIFVIGDAACVMKNNIPLPATAPAAIQAGKYVASLHQKCSAQEEKRKSFCYFDKGNMATIGKAKAIVQYKSLKLSGFFAWLIWAFVHIAYLIGFRSSIAVMLEWGSALITGQRGVRLITRPIDK